MALRLLYFFLSCIFPMMLIGQIIDEKYFTLYSTKDGLSNNTINAIEQDAYGFLWVATRKGLNRFDGNSFQQFFSDSSKNSLPSDNIRSLKWLGDEQLAAVTLLGLHIINTKTLKQRNLTIPADSLMKSYPLNSAFDASGDKKGNVFVLTRTGFYHFNNTDELTFRYDHYSRKESEAGAVQFGWEIILADDSTVLLSTAKGLYIYNIPKKNLHPVNNNDNELYRQILPTPGRFWFIHNNEKSFSTVLYPQEKKFVFFDKMKKTKHLITDSAAFIEKLRPESAFLQLNDTLFIITTPTAGFHLIRYNIKTGAYKIEPQPFFEKYLCPSMFIDKKNHLWVGTTEGLFRQKRQTAAIEQVAISFISNAYDKFKHISSIIVADDKVFTGVSLGELIVLDRDSLKQIKQIQWPGPALINKIISLNPDTFLIGSPGILLNNKTLVSRSLTSPFLPKGINLLKDPYNNVYINAYNSDTLYFRNANEKEYSILKLRDLSKIRYATHINKDPEGNLWFGGQGGVLRLNKKSQIFDIFLDSFPSIRAQRKTITSNFEFDKKGNVYFGNSENGLIIYNYDQKKFSQLTRSDGLPDNIVISLFLYNNKLWIGTNGGIANYDLVTKKVSSFDLSDGYIPDVSYAPFYYDSVNRHLYTGLKDILYRFDPEKFTKNSSPPDFYIERINIGPKQDIYYPGSQIHLSYKNNNIVVHLASINFEDANQQLFAYRLTKKGDEPWEEIGSQQRIIFNNLSAGSHKLQMKVYTRNNSWPEQIKEITIVVQPPFWKTIWFILLSVFLLVYALYIFYRARIKNIKQRADIDRQITELEIKGLHSQMNPHFIFNCLNSIREMILNNENQQASHYLSKFAQLIRVTLNQSSKQFITLENTIDYLERYIEMERIRNNKFSYRIEVDEGLHTDEIMIPPMLIQPFIENAIWHGILPGKELQINVRFVKESDRLVCYVEDNGPGIEVSMNKKKEMHITHNSIGIANVMERIKVLNEKYKLQSELSIVDKAYKGGDSGTVVKLNFPINSIAS